MEEKTLTKPSKEVIFANLDQKVQAYLSQCGNCAQTSFITLQEQFELDDGGAILKALTPFPGIALRGETCGAVVGCLMALGLIYGRERLDDWPGYLASLRPARRFCRRFEQELGSTMCADILEKELGKRFNLADAVEALEYAASGGAEKCTAVIQKGVRIAAKLIPDSA
jgi:C_GCAxxG_C_C family probable redox protein